MIWFLYVVRCSDNTLYTGITNNTTRRVHEHNHTKKGAKYTSKRRPVLLQHFWEYPDHREAARAEIQFKKLTRPEKESFLKNPDTWYKKTF